MLSRINKLRESLDDNEAVFISSYPNIFYYSTFTSEDAYLLISHDELLIITDSRYTIQAKEQAKDFKVVDIREGLGKIFKKLNVKYIGFEEKVVSVDMYNTLTKALSDGQTLVPMNEKISSFRRVKDEDEIRRIAEAERLGDEAFKYVLGKIKSGKTEKDIALELEFFMKKHGASGLSFETIAASGIRGAMPHGEASDKIIEQGELLTLDFGCVLDGYCSDMTRTVAIGEVSDRHKEIYNTVLKAQLAAIDKIKIGSRCSDIDAAARKVIEDAGYGKNFGHSLGHSVGIEIHEMPIFSPKSKDVVHEGNVITVEPGIYVEGFGGVRIEDLTVIIDNGLRNLTGSPKELIVL